MNESKCVRCTVLLSRKDSLTDVTRPLGSAGQDTKLESALMATLEDFERLDIRVGVVREARPFPDGKYSTHVLMIDLGEELGTKKSLARLLPNYDDGELTGRQILCVVNFPPRQIGKHLSEVLTLGVPDAEGNVVLIGPDREVPLGGKLY